MLRNNADPRRCSYFQLGLPVWAQEKTGVREGETRVSLGHARSLFSPLLQAPATQATEMQSGAFLDTILWNVTDCAPTSSRLDNFSDIVNYIL